MEFKHFYKNTYVIEGYDTSAVYMLRNGRCVLIDNGLSEEEKDLIALLEENHLVPEAIICTHLHRDHHGNTIPLREKFGSTVIMAEGEADKCRNLMTLRRYVEYPYRNSYYKWVIDERMHCRADISIPPFKDSIDICGETFGIVHTPGHSCDHICVITPDNVCFIGDVIMPIEAVRAAKLPYMEDFVKDRESKLKLLNVKCDHWIFSHKGTYIGKIDEIVKENVSKMDEILEAMYHLLDDKPMTKAVLFRQAREELHLYRHDPQRINEYKRMLRPYLEHLLNTERIGLQDNEGIIYYGHFDEKTDNK